jgi:subtilisin family serine protease
MWSLLTIFFLQFANKAGSDVVCLSPTAQAMRAERGIEIDSLDYAVSPVYLDSVSHLGAKVLHTSRWMNGATVEASNEVIREIEKCAFVDTVYLTRVDKDALGIPSVSLRKREAKDERLEMTSEEMGQLEQLNLLPLHQAGYKGKGIRIGVADGGFYHADSLESLPREQWIGYADFTDDKNDIFGSTGKHGALCLTAIVGTSADYQGAATEAEYFLFRTEEHSTESPKEIDNWVAAIEMADSLGLHIVSTSLGYTTFDNQEMNFTYADMDGKTSRGAQAAAIATRKGMLLVVAMGNDGNKAWHYLSTPADADSILSVGAVDVAGEIAGFSSYGPSADGRVKPEVCAVGAGTALINPADNEVTDGNGTSFACPLIAGMAASLWSAVPKASNMEIREQIIRSADRYTTPHEQYGYGVPNAWEAYNAFMSADMQSIRVTSTAKKLLKNGQLYILHEGKIYDILGHRL